MNLKKIISILVALAVILLNSIGLSAQSKTAYSLNVKYKESFIGKGILVGSNIDLGANFLIQPSIRFQINTIAKSNEGQVFFQTMKANTPIQYLGLDLTVIKEFKIDKLSPTPYICLNGEFGRMSRSVLLINDIWSGKKTNFETDIPLKMLCNTLGAGMSFPIIRNLEFNIEAGLGIAYIWDIDERVIELDRNPGDHKTTMLVWNYLFGLKYEL